LLSIDLKSVSFQFKPARIFSHKCETINISSPFSYFEGFENVMGKLSWLDLTRPTLSIDGQKSTAVLHFKDINAYALLITFQKTEKEFSPTTMYADYPISRSQRY